MVQIKSETKYVFVDLDGTLIKSDLLFESLLILLKEKPLKIFKAIFILFKFGKARFKSFLANEIEINPQTLPYNNHLLDYLLHERISGRKIFLATASNIKFANQVKDHLAVFEGVIASDNEINLKGSNKLPAINAITSGEPFEYIGNSRADLEIWQESGEATIVSNDQKLIRDLVHIKNPKYLFSDDVNKLKSILHTIRIHQWAKNILLFVPIIMAQKLFDIYLVLDLLVAFLSFSLTASAVYILNDLLDLDADRLHSTKKNRPIAAGHFFIGQMFLLFPLLLSLGLLLSLTLPIQFFWTLILYLTVTILYSFYLKKIVVFDIIILAVLYSIRIFAGGTATNILVSPWLIAFSIFFFLSLASLKRYIELLRTVANKKETIVGRGYIASDLSIVSQAGLASGFISVLVLALYINSVDVTKFYQHQYYLWFFCPILLYWIFRIWLLASRGQVSEDPVIYAIKDRGSYILGVIGILTLILASL